MTSSAAKRSGTLGRILENTGWLVSSKAVGAALSFFYLALATRSLGVERFGQFALALGAAQTVAALVGFQTWQVVVRFGMPHLAAKDEDKLDDLVLFALTLDVIGAVIGCLILLAGIEAFANYFAWSATLRLQALLFALVMVLAFHSTPVGILRLHDRFSEAAMADTLTPIVRMLGALAAVTLGASVVGFLIAWALAEVSTAIASWWLAHRRQKIRLGRWRWSRMRAVLADHPGLARFAGVTNVNFSLNGVSRQLPAVIVGFFVGAIAAGQFRLVQQLGLGLAKFGDMVARAIFAEFARVHAAATREQLSRLFRGALRFSLGAAVLVMLFLLVAGKLLLAAIAGNAFLPAYPLLLLLGVSAALNLGGVGFEPALMATGRAGEALGLRLLTTALQLGLMVALLPTFGTIGAGFAAVVASVVGLALFGIAAWRAIHAVQDQRAL